LKAFLSAIQFLTIIPVRIDGNLSPADMGRSCAYYPLVGAIQGILTGTAAILLAQVLPAGVVAALFVLLTVLVSGGFHQDGLSDTLDALGLRVHGSSDEVRGRRLEVMKGSTAGPMGGTGITLSLLIKVLCIAAIVEYAGDRAGLLLATLASATVFGKWSMVAPLVLGQPARREGLGQLIMGHAGAAEFLGALGTAVSFGLLVALLMVPAGLKTSFLSLFFTLIAVLYLLSVMVRRLATAAFGGLTGDVFGLMNEISEMLYLVVVSGWLRQSI